MIYAKSMNVLNICTTKVCQYRLSNGVFVEYYPMYIGRKTKNYERSPWANMYVIPGDGDRDTVIEKYHACFRSSGLVVLCYRLLGLTLACWCKPSRCHGDILVQYTNGMYTLSMGTTTLTESLSFISGVRAFDLYLSILGTEALPVYCDMFPQIVLQKNAVSVYSPDLQAYVIEFVGRPNNHITSYLMIQSQYTLYIEILANSFDDYWRGFNASAIMNSSPVPMCMKVVYTQRLSLDFRLACCEWFSCS